MIHRDKGLNVVTQIDSFLILQESENTVGEEAVLLVSFEKIHYPSVSLYQEVKNTYLMKIVKFH